MSNELNAQQTGLPTNKMTNNSNKQDDQQTG